MDRKALKLEYKNRERQMGIFRIRNTINGKSFVGTGTDLATTLRSQRGKLWLGGHPNRELQGDWNEFGEGAFEFEVLDTLRMPERPNYDPTDDLRALEELWLDKLSPFDDRGYNRRPSLK